MVLAFILCLIEHTPGSELTLTLHFSRDGKILPCFRVLEVAQIHQWAEAQTNIPGGDSYVLERSQKGTEKRILILFIERLLRPSHLKYLTSFNLHYYLMKAQSVPKTLSCLICNLGTDFLFKFSWLVSGTEIRYKIYLTSEHIPSHCQPIQCFCIKQSKAPLWEDTVLQWWGTVFVWAVHKL